MKESLARALSGPISLMEDEWRERPVDHLHAIGSAQLLRVADRDCAAAQERSRLCVFGRDIYAYINLPLGDDGARRAFFRAVEGLAEELLLKGRRISLRGETARLVAHHALREAKDATCRVCNGRTDEVSKTASIPDTERLANWKPGDGPVPMKPCPACYGTGKHKYSDAERNEAIGEYHKTMDRAFAVAHTLISRAIWEIDSFTRELRRD